MTNSVEQNPVLWPKVHNQILRNGPQRGKLSQIFTVQMHSAVQFAAVPLALNYSIFAAVANKRKTKFAAVDNSREGPKNSKISANLTILYIQNCFISQSKGPVRYCWRN
jgi:hypothetical protein